MGNLNKDNLEPVRRMHSTSVWGLFSILLFCGGIMGVALSKGGSMIAGIFIILSLGVLFLWYFAVSTMAKSDSKKPEEKPKS